MTGTEHERIMTANEVFLKWSELEVILARLDKACHEFQHEKIRDILLSTPTGFSPTDGICDLVWLQKNHGSKNNGRKDKKVIPLVS